MEKELISTDEAPRAIGPYSQAVRSAGLLYCSGQIGLDPLTGELSGGLVDQVRRALQNLVAVLAAAGADPKDVVKTTVYLAEMDDFAAMNELYGEVFSEEPPARATVAVKTLPKGALFEIDAIAQLPG
ncbi:MAG: Rid family detoxifying hydrolase [Actinomycetota bacterium]